jgi:hypothetical protein
MDCAEFEVLLSDYLDGTLDAAGRAALEQHAAGCSGCREFMEEVAGAVRFAKMAAPVVPPPELITRIAFYAPAARLRLPFERQGFWSKLAERWVRPVLQPRFAMGMAMTILSFAMLERCTGVPVSHIQAADLSPQRVWSGVEDRALRVRDRAVKYYENIRLVYEIESRIKELQDSPAPAPSNGQAQQPQSGGTKQPDGGDSHPTSLNNQPDRNNGYQGGSLK